MSKEVSLMSSQVFNDQSDLSQRLQRDAEMVLGCAVEIENLIDYFQGSHPQLIVIGLNKLFSVFNQSNLLHLEIKQIADSSTANKTQVLTLKNQFKAITLDVRKDITNTSILQTLNYYIDKNLAEFNIAYQMSLLELDQNTQYSKELLKDIFYSDERIQDQFDKRKSSFQQQSFLRRSMTLQLTPTMKDIILEKIKYRKSTMLNKLEHRFPKLANIDGILPYILGLYIYVDSEGFLGDFQSKKQTLQAIEKETLNKNFDSVIPLLQSEYLKLLVTYDLQSFIIGNYNTTNQIRFDKIIQSIKWIDYDKLLLQQLLYSSKQLKDVFIQASNQVNQFKDYINLIIEKIFLIVKELKPHEFGGYENNYQKIEKMLTEFGKYLTDVFNENTNEIKNSLRIIIFQLLKMIEGFHNKFKSKTAITVLLKLKLQFQEFTKKMNKQQILHEHTQVQYLSEQIARMFKTNTVFASSDLIIKILQSNEGEVSFDDVLSKLKYSNKTDEISRELKQISSLIENEVVKKFMIDVQEYLFDRKKKKEVQLNHHEVSLHDQDKEILNCMTDQVVIAFINENRAFFLAISQYILANDPFKKFSFRNSINGGKEIAALAIKFDKSSNLVEFLQQFEDVSINRAQIQLTSQLSQSDIKEWKDLISRLL